MSDYIKQEDCQDGWLYEIDGRNASFGVCSKNDKGEVRFTVRRYKWGETFLDVELHWDLDPRYGTAKPLRAIERVPEGTELLVYLTKQKESE